MKERFARFMAGRYGNDQLNLFLLLLSVVFLLLGSIFGSVVGTVFHVLAVALLVLCYFRMFSRKIDRRREENGRYIRLRYKVTGWLKGRKERWVQRKDYKFFLCPSCHTTLRVPRGHGKICIVCRKCGFSFTRKS